MPSNLPAPVAGQHPFKRHRVRSRSWWERLFRRPRPEIAQQAIESLLAERFPAIVWPAEMSTILAAYGVRADQARRILVSLWRQALAAFLADNALSEDETKQLVELRRLLGVTEGEAIAAERELVHPRFQRLISEVLADRHASDEERSALDRLADALRLAPAIRQQLYAEPASKLLAEAMDASLADKRLSPQEFTAFEALAKNLGVVPRFEGATEQLLKRYGLYWRIENGDLPTVHEVPIALQKGERCHFACDVDWYEFRKRTTTVGYGSHGVSVRIARGVYYRIGATKPLRVTDEGLELIDSGAFYITSKRVLFDGGRKNTAIRFTSLIGFDVFADGIILEKATGRSPVLAMKGDVELAAVILGALLAMPADIGEGPTMKPTA